MTAAIKTLIFSALITAITATAQAVELNALFTDHMVLQRNTENKVWGTGTPNENITVSMGAHSLSTQTDANGKWSVQLPAHRAGGPHQLIIQGHQKRVIKDILFGEVWVCSGQSNMQWSLSNNNDYDLLALQKQPANIRIITIPNKGTQDPQGDFNGAWHLATDLDMLRHFSAVGYHFGKNLHLALDVPIGLIGCSWGGSAAEAWVKRPLLESDLRYANYLSQWDKKAEEGYDFEAAKAAKKEKRTIWLNRVEQAKANGQKPPKEPWYDMGHIHGQHRPANLYNGMLKPIMGYGIQGVIWYQGESNTGRSNSYNHLFGTLISSWRSEWAVGDFPFYWVNLANFQDRSEEPQESNWAELREAQTQTLSLPNTGEALAIDLGEASDIHPRDKQSVGDRLARIALARDYGKDIAYLNPQFSHLELKSKKLVLNFKNTGKGLRTIDAREARGFAIAGADKNFVWAQAKIIGEHKIAVWNDHIAEPKYVRYGWAQNPEVNIYSKERLPLTPFRATVK